MAKSEVESDKKNTYSKGDSSKRRDVERTLKILRYFIKRRFDVVSTSFQHLEESSQY